MDTANHVGPSFHHSFLKDKDLKTRCLSATFKQKTQRSSSSFISVLQNPLLISPSSDLDSIKIRKQKKNVPKTHFFSQSLSSSCSSTFGFKFNFNFIYLLQSQGLPAGLFPDNVKSYDLDHFGRLEVHLDWPCLSKFETRVFYESVVRANLTFGGLTGLQGMSQEELFLWLPVKGITVNDPSSGLILFDIGVAHKQLSLSLFEDPPVFRPQGIMRKMGAFQAWR